MRIFLLLAAAGAAAIATAAPARPSGKPGGHGAASGAWAAGGGGHRGRSGLGRSGWEGRSRPALGRGDGRHRGRHGDRHGPYFDGGYVYAGPGGIVEPYGDGFFAGGGGDVWMKGNRPHYDYDRSYPYEFASRRGPRPEWEEEPRPAAPGPRCTIEHGVRVCRGW